MQNNESRLSIANSFSSPVKWFKVKLTTAQVLVAYLYSVLAIYGVMYSHDYTLVYLAVFVVCALGLTHYQIKKAEKKKEELDKLNFK